MKLWIGMFTRGIKHSRVRWFGRAFYYYLILVALAVVYFMQQQHAPAPFIYSNF